MYDTDEMIERRMAILEHVDWIMLIRKGDRELTKTLKDFDKYYVKEDSSIEQFKKLKLRDSRAGLLRIPSQSIVRDQKELRLKSEQHLEEFKQKMIAKETTPEGRKQKEEEMEKWKQTILENQRRNQ